MKRRFACTACGACCRGSVPLTIKDALAHAGRFPLALVWTVIVQASKAFEITARLGTKLRLPNRKTVALRISPAGYLPAHFPCPALEPSNLCGIHETKPSRCRSMPFFPYVDEGEQASLLVPRAGWECDVSDAAPVVYRDGQILPREEFDLERRDLLAQAPLLRAYAASTLAVSPSLVQDLLKASRVAGGGHVITAFTALLPRLAKDDVLAFARAQLPVLRGFAAATAGDTALAAYHRRYRDWSREVERIAAYASPQPGAQG